MAVAGNFTVTVCTLVFTCLFLFLFKCIYHHLFINFFLWVSNEVTKYFHQCALTMKLLRSCNFMNVVTVNMICKHKFWWPFESHWTTLIQLLCFNRKAWTLTVTALQHLLPWWPAMVRQWRDSHGVLGICRHFIIILFHLLPWPRPCKGCPSNRSAH